MERMRDMHQGFDYHFWSDKNLPKMPAVLAQLMTRRREEENYALAADVLRLFVLQEYGGVYLDVDTEPITGLHGLDIDGAKGIFRRHGDEDLTISNDFMGLDQGSPLSQHLVSAMTPGSFWIGPGWVGEQVRAFYGVAASASHQTLEPRLTASGITYLPSRDGQVAGATDWWENHFRNHALYSWSPENKKRFREGAYE